MFNSRVALSLTVCKGYLATDKSSECNNAGLRKLSNVLIITIKRAVLGASCATLHKEFFVLKSERR